MKQNRKDKLPIITEENEHEYWIEFRKNLSPRIREAIVKKYAPLVKYAANKINISTKNIRDIEFEDLVGFGSFGLLDAIDRYDPNKDVKFKTYALTRIMGSIYDELRKLDSLPRSIRKDIKEVEKARELLEIHLRRDAKPEEIINMLGITMDKYNELMGYGIQSSVTSLSGIFYTGDDADEISIMDTLKSSDKTNPEYLAEREAVKKQIVEALKKLPEKEQQVLILYYYEDLTLKEIGVAMEVSESRVSQLHGKAIQDLRHSLSEIKKSLI